MGYWGDATYFWEFKATDAIGATKWQRYKVEVQQHLYEQLNKNKKLTFLKFETHEFIFDHETSNHRHHDIITGTECAMQRTPEVIVRDWNEFKAMSDADVSKITKLKLYGDWISNSPKVNDEDVLELIPRLKSCKSLWFLDLGANNLTDVSGVALWQALSTNATLAMVWLGWNKFDEQTGIEIEHAMSTNMSLEVLGVNHNNLGEKGGAAIVRGLKTNTTLTRLDLGGNLLGEESGVALATWLATNTRTRLKCLGLDDNNLGDPSGVAFAKALSTNTTLERLSLSRNNLGDPSGVAIATALTTNTTLNQLLLGPHGKTLSCHRFRIMISGRRHWNITAILDTVYKNTCTKK